GPSDALRAVELLRPKLVLPCHYNTWPPIAQDAEAWIKDVRQLGKTNALALRVGDTHVLS
ncbi:MAG: metal-dependent hydrolase, partial [Planctomycetaceae bacterium]